MRTLSICIIAILFSSCTRIFNRTDTYFNLHVSRGSTVIYKNVSGHIDTMTSGNSTELVLDVQRSCGRLPLTIVHDSVAASIAVRPIFSGVYYLNLLSYGIGFLADIGTLKKYAYPYNVYLNPAVAKGYSALKPLTTPAVQLSLFPPLLTLCNIGLGDIESHGVGTMLAAGVNYFLGPRSFYSFSAGIAGEPVRIAERFYTDSMPRFTDTRKSGWYIDAQRHSVFRRFDIGYGLSAGQRSGSRYYAHYRGATYEFDSVYYKTKIFAAGCSISASFRISPSFYVGINYQPQFLEAGDKTVWRYSHFISGGFYWRIKLL